MDDPTSSFGYWMRRRRKALDLTQAALALKVSCSAAAIKKIEADERRPSRGLAERLADHLSIASHQRATFLALARSHQGANGLPVDALPLAPITTVPGEKLEPAGDRKSPFVGRGIEYGQLLGLLARLTTGSGQVVLIEGEAGIGKSRLMHEAARYARQRALTVLTSRCYEMERRIAYQPVIDLATQAWQAAHPTSLHRLAPTLLAEIAALLPGVASGLTGLPTLSADFPEARQARLFHALLALLDALAQQRQLILMIDDIQWADDASLQFLHFLARQITSRPVLLVCAYRDEELRSNESLAGLVASLRREPDTRHFALAQLEAGDTLALLQGLDDPRLCGPDLAARLHSESDGNPFFLWSIVDAMRDGADFGPGQGAALLPDSLRDSVRVRLARLPPENRALLDLAAVLGRRFDFETLQALTGRCDQDFLHAMESLVLRRLLRESASREDGEFYDFSHDKIREVVYRDLGMARRVLLHRAVAEMLEQQSTSLTHERVARLAEQFERAKVWHKALHYLGLAGEQSQKLFALREALQWFDRAVALQQAHPESAGASGPLVLYEQRGVARAQAGQIQGAVADLQYVIAGARALGHKEHARDVLIQLGMAYRRADAYDDATACLDEALVASRALDDERHAADSLYHLGTVAWSNGRNDLAIGYHQEAVDICERLGLSDLIAVQAFHGRGEAHFANAEPAAAIASFSRSLALARGITDRSYEAENLMMIGWACIGPMGLADFPRALEQFDAALDIASAADLQWHLGPTVIGRAGVRAAIGDYGAAWTDLIDVLPRLESLKQLRYQIMAHDALGCLLLDLNLAGPAQQQFEQGMHLAQRVGIRYWQPRLQANLALAQMRQGVACNHPALLAALQVASDHSEIWLMLRCLEALAEHALSESNADARGAVRACAALVDPLLALATRGGLQEVIAQGQRLRGIAALAGGDDGAAREKFTLALQGAEAVGRIRLVWDCRAALAMIAARRGAAADQKKHQAHANALAARIAQSLNGTGVISGIPCLSPDQSGLARTSPFFDLTPLTVTQASSATINPASSQSP